MYIAICILPRSETAKVVLTDTPGCVVSITVRLLLHACRHDTGCLKKQLLIVLCTVLLLFLLFLLVLYKYIYTTSYYSSACLRALLPTMMINDSATICSRPARQ